MGRDRHDWASPYQDSRSTPLVNLCNALAHVKCASAPYVVAAELACYYGDTLVKIIWTNHAEERQREWERMKGVTRDVVQNVVLSPSQVVPGDRDTRVAQSQWQGGLLRIPFIETRDGRKVLTVYWTSRTKRYWREQP